MIGAVDQRSDEIESPEAIVERMLPALEYFSPDRLLLSSDCGFQHVPLDITRGKLRALVAGARLARQQQRIEGS